MVYCLQKVAYQLQKQYIHTHTKILRLLQDCYNLVCIIFHNLVRTLSTHCDKLVFETCNILVTKPCHNLVISLINNYGICKWVTLIQYHEQSYIMQFSHSYPVEVNIDVLSSIAYQLHLLYKRFNFVYVTCNLTIKCQYSLWYSVFISLIFNHLVTRL